MAWIGVAPREKSDFVHRATRYLDRLLVFDWLLRSRNEPRRDDGDAGPLDRGWNFAVPRLDGGAAHRVILMFMPNSFVTVSTAASG